MSRRLLLTLMWLAARKTASLAPGSVARGWSGGAMSMSTALSRTSTAQEVVDKFAAGGLSGKTAVVTGGNSGIGLETARVLAGAGCKVVLCSRSVTAGEEAAAAIVSAGGDVVVQELDLADLESVEAAAASIEKKITEKLDFLILNAGIMALPRAKYTSSGFEMQVGVNHFGHVHLTNQLMDRVKSDASRVVVLSSTAHNLGSVDCDDLHFSKGRRYAAWTSYGQSKACNLLYAKSLSEKLRGTGASAFSVHPGVIKTNLWREPPAGITLFGLDKVITNIGLGFVADKTVPQGAATTLFACLAPRLEESFPGAYFADCDVKMPGRGVTADPSLRERLWETTEAQLADAVASRRPKPAQVEPEVDMAAVAAPAAL